MKKKVGILINNFGEEISKIIPTAMNKLIDNNVNLCIFTNNYIDLGNQNVCKMPIGTINYFKGEILCFNSYDALLVLNCKRDIKIKYLLHEESVENIVNLYDDKHDDKIEYLIPNESYRLIGSILKIENKDIRTLEEYCDER